MPAPVSGGPIAPPIGGLNGGIQSLAGGLGSMAPGAPTGAPASAPGLNGMSMAQQIAQQIGNAHPSVQGMDPGSLGVLLAQHPDLIQHPAFGGLNPPPTPDHGLGLAGRYNGPLVRPDHGLGVPGRLGRV